jgi:hypothetical protein
MQSVELAVEIGVIRELILVKYASSQAKTSALIPSTPEKVLKWRLDIAST